MEPKDIIRFIYKEFYANKEDNSTDQYLTFKGMQEEGIIIPDLKIIEQSLDRAKFKYSENSSKFKVGDYPSLKSENNSINVKITEMTLDTITVEADFGYTISNLSKEENWYVAPRLFNLPLKIAEIVHYQLNAQSVGWRFFQLLFSDSKPNVQRISINLTLERKLIREVFNSVKLIPDHSQEDAILECLQMPELFSVQGPPGTGKTIVLSVLAKLLADRGKRVFVISHSHHAVNTELLQIHKIDSTLPIIKVGEYFNAKELPGAIRKLPKARVYIENINSYPKRTIVGLSFYGAIITLLNPNPSYKPDFVLVDEASQLSLYLGALTGLLNPESVVLFGDHQQMPPIFNEILLENELATSVLEQAVLQQKEAFLPLNTTYRMNKALTKLIGNACYLLNDSEKTFLKSHSANAARTFPIKIQSDNEVIRDIFNPEYSFVWVKTPLNFSRQVNYFEADLVSKMIYECLKHGLSISDFIVVTPYRKQINEITRQTLKKYPNITQLPMIETVEKAQGQSVELVIVSYVTSDPDYFEDLSHFLYSKNRLNVAISRAKTKVVFLSSDAILDVIPENYSGLVTLNILRSLKKNACKVIEF